MSHSLNMQIHLKVLSMLPIRLRAYLSNGVLNNANRRSWLEQYAGIAKYLYVKEKTVILCSGFKTERETTDIIFIKHATGWPNTIPAM